jgi:stearoyl-CoA desaturase (Delta-9 desaturase)
MDYITGGLLQLPLWGYFIYTLVLVHLTIMGVTLYLHRDQTHRAVDLHPAVGHVFRFWLWLTTGMLTREWVAVHRKHHARCETEEDPHSPQIVGLRKVLLEGAELYRAEASNPETVEKFGRGAPDDWIERRLYTRFPILGVSTLMVINLALLGVGGLSVWAVQMMAIPFFAAGVVNGLGHYWGYRNFECRDAATNVSPLGLMLGGEELHNNHHAFPSSAKFSLRRWEFDIGWLWIRSLSAVGLARVRRVAPSPMVAEGAARGKGLDLDTVRAVILNRYHVLRDYSRTVMLPTVRQELRDRSARVVRRAKRLLVREPTLLNDEHQSTLATLLEDYGTLNTLYQYRQRLKEIWESTTHNDQLLKQFRDWCAQAEASGIRQLQEFARRLQDYRMPVGAMA